MNGKRILVSFLCSTSLMLSAAHSVIAANRVSNVASEDVSITDIANDTTANPVKNDLSDPSKVINALFPYIFSGAGLILFAMLIMGGFDMMTAGTDAKKAEAGKARITSAIIGFAIIFAAYWIVQILEIVLGISILK